MKITDIECHIVVVPDLKQDATSSNDKLSMHYVLDLKNQKHYKTPINLSHTFTVKTLISSVTDAVIDDVHAWQSRPLDAVYPIVYMDCIFIKVRENKRIINKAVYLALGVDMEGQKELLV